MLLIKSEFAFILDIFSEIDKKNKVSRLFSSASGPLLWSRCDTCSFYTSLDISTGFFFIVILCLQPILPIKSNLLKNRIFTSNLQPEVTEIKGSV